MTLSQKDWEMAIADLLLRYRNGWEPFSSSSLYYCDLDPWDNDALNAKIDLDRGIEAGCRTPTGFIAFLNILEEGWFFEEKAEFYRLIREYIAQGGTIPGAIPGRLSEP